MKVQGPSDRLLDLIFDALEDALASAHDMGTPIVPFLVAQTGAVRRRRPLVVHLGDGAAAAGRRLASDQGRDVDCVVFVYDGFLTTPEGKSDAILLEAHQRGMSRSLIFAQRYRRKTFLRDFSVVGNPLLFAACEPFLDNLERLERLDRLGRLKQTALTSRDVDFF